MEILAGHRITWTPHWQYKEPCLLHWPLFPRSWTLMVRHGRVQGESVGHTPHISLLATAFWILLLMPTKGQHQKVNAGFWSLLLCPFALSTLWPGTLSSSAPHTPPFPSRSSSRIPRPGQQAEKQLGDPSVRNLVTDLSYELLVKCPEGA